MLTFYFLFARHGRALTLSLIHIYIDVWDFADETEADTKNKGLKEETSNVYGNGRTSLFADVMDAIENDRQPYVDAVAGRLSLIHI